MKAKDGYKCCVKGAERALLDVSSLLTQLQSLREPSIYDDDDAYVITTAYDPWREPPPMTDGEVEPLMGFVGPNMPPVLPPPPMIRVMPMRIAQGAAGVFILSAVGALAELVGSLQWYRSLATMQTAVAYAVSETDARGRRTCAECLADRLLQQGNKISKVTCETLRRREGKLF